MRSIETDMIRKLHRREQEGNLRSLSFNKSLVDFSSNDYLGFARNYRWPSMDGHHLRASGSRLLSGHHPLFEELEKLIAHFHRGEAGLIFNSGYTANVGLLSAIAGDGDTFLFDTHVHASMHEGMRLSRAHCFPWRHKDLCHLEKRLKNRFKKGIIFVLIESVYSCDGSQAPLKDICFLCEKYHAKLIVDEAHATGLIGNCGEGLAVHLSCQDRIFARLYTFSKSLGAFGAIILGSEVLRQFLINFSCPFIYTTALPLPILYLIREAYYRLANSIDVIERLHDLIRYFRDQARIFGLEFYSSDTSIQAFPVEGNSRAKGMAETLTRNGFDVRALLSPTVRRGKECLRICVHAFNTKQQIDDLFKVMKEFVEN